VRAAALLVVAACTGNGVVVEPVIDLPSNDSASAFPVDDLVLSVAHSGSTADLVAQTFASNQLVEMPGVPFGDDLVIHMTGHIGSSEVAYGRTCKLAVNQNAATPAPHLFFSRSVKFADLALPVQPEPRRAGNGVADVDGAGLVLGGVDPIDGTSPVADVERFDPRTGELRLLATVDPRIGAVAAALGTGGDARIALLGGQDPLTGVGATFVELLEPDAPAARRYERIDDAQMARVGLTATALTDGRVIAIGGMPIGGVPSDAVDEVSISNGSATVRVLRALLAHPRYRHTATRLGDDVGAPVLVAGGLDAAGLPVLTAELFKPLAEGFSKTFTANAMVVARSGHQAVLMPDGSVLILGGVGIGGATVNVTDTLERFTLDAGFVAVGLLPPNAGLVDFAATPLPDGRVLLTGGRRCEDTTMCPPLDTAFIARLDPIDGSVDVVATDHMSIARAGHQATLLCDGTVLVTGGTDAPSVAERYNPPALGRR
jgi:hypothetical protein